MASPTSAKTLRVVHSLGHPHHPSSPKLALWGSGALRTHTTSGSQPKPHAPGLASDPTAGAPRPIPAHPVPPARWSRVGSSCSWCTGCRGRESGTLKAGPRAVQLRCSWHCSELELLAEKVPRNTAGTACSGCGCLRTRTDYGVRRAGVVLAQLRSWHGGPPHPHPLGAAMPAPGGQGVCSRQKPPCAKKLGRQRQARLWVALHGRASSLRSAQMTLQ